MVHRSILSLVLLVPSALLALAAPGDLYSRADPDNTVHVTSADNFCIIVPRDAHTNVGDSEHPGGMKSYCSSQGKSSSSQGDLPANFWRNVEFKSGNGVNGGRFAQLTGCINPSGLDRINPDDAGGQYDSSGGDGGRGNPQGSVCTGYNHYVELLEPRGPRTCIRCCDDPADCPVDKDTSGCPSVISGNYFNCG
ncbi:hypothetical protein BD779DRAFT_159792 [Infundibulicybe gibba]|nr:hypothetical protein BD779DRAFT_159792 [Infundibulicybe gibba]